MDASYLDTILDKIADPVTRALVTDSTGRILAATQKERIGVELASVYNAFGSEADLTNVIRQAKLDGKRICWPCCLTQTEMAAFIPDGEDAWKAGAFGIREPIVKRSSRIPPEEIDLVLCPCAAY